MNSRAAFDTGPLSWVKGEIDLSMQRGIDVIRAAGAGWARDALTHLHQANGALQIVGLAGVTRVMEELEGLLSDVDKGALPADSANALAARGFVGVTEYLDQLMTGAANHPLRLLPLYRDLVQARATGAAPTAAREIDPTDLYFPKLSFRPPRRDKIPVPLHPEEADRYYRDQRARFQRGFVRWLKKDIAGAAEMREAVEAIELTQGLTAERSFWWAAVGFFDALSRDALPAGLDNRRLCNRIEAQVRRLLDGSQNVAERLLRETLYYVAHARPDSEAIRLVQDTFQLAQSLPAPEAPAVAAMPAALKPARDLLGQAGEAWNRFAAGHPQALQAFATAASALAARTAKLGHPGLTALAARVAEVAVWAGQGAGKMNEAIAVEVAVALLLAEHALDQLGADPASPGAQFDRYSEFVCARLAAGMAGKLLRTASGMPLLDEMSARAQERLMVNQVVAEMQHSLRLVENVLDGFFRNPAQRDSLARLDQPLSQLAGALDVLGEARARAALDAVIAEIARIALPGYAPRQAEFEAVAQTLSGLGLYVNALARGEADFDTMMRPIEAQPQPDGSGVPAHATVEAQLEAQQEKARDLFEEWKRKPGDTLVKAELQKELNAIRQDAGLVADSALEVRAGEALKAIEDDSALPLTPAVEQVLQDVAPAPLAAAPSAQAARLVDASEETVDAELLSVYLEEADELLATAAEYLARLQRNVGANAGANDGEALTAIRRAFHTLKGSGRMVGLTRLGEAAWSVEQTLNRWLQDERAATPELLALVDAARAYFIDAVAQLRGGGRAGDASALLAMGEAVRNGAPVALAPASPPVQQAVPAGDQGTAPAAEASVSPEAPEVAAAAAETVQLGDHRISTTLFTLFSGEAHALLQTIRAEHETLQQHGIITDDMLRATHTLAGIAGTVELGALRDLGRAFEGALSRLAADSLSTDEAQLVGDAIDAVDTMVSSAVALQVPPPQPVLISRLEGVALPAAESPQPYHRDDAGVLPEEEASLPRAEEAADAPRIALVPVVAPAAAIDPVLDDAGVERRQRRFEDELDPQMLQVFLVEAAELAPAIGSALREWRAAPDNRAAGQSLQRLLHTYKGGARMAGAMGLGELTHNMETRIEKALVFKKLPANLFDELDSAFDRLQRLLENLGESLAAGNLARPPGLPAPAAEPVADAATLLVRDGDAVRAMLRVRADMVDRLVNQAGEVSIARSRIEGELRALKGAMRELTDNVARLRGQLREIEIQAESQMQARSADAQQKEGFDPLEFDRFTRFQELTRLMAESVNDVQTVHQALLLAADGTEAALATQARLNRDLQQDLMRVRMVPFASLSERLYRIVRQTAKDTGKRANLDIRGGTTELDRSVLERITAPFEHMLRNAVTHGIEMPDARARAGKPEMGDIRLEVSQEGNEVRLSLADDGAGLQLARIRARAVELGMLEPDEKLSDAEIAELIFLPGLSTADAVSQVAGRGVGMDVVRNEVAALGGRVEVGFTPGAGTRFAIYLPLTLAVTQAVLVRVGTRSFAVPAVMVEQVSQFRPEQIADAREKRFASWQERRHAFHYLPQLLGMDGAAAEKKRLLPVLFLKSGSSAIALHVDDILGSNQEIVVKAIGPQLQRVPGITGATVLGSGEIALILNPVQLAQHFDQRAAAQTALTGSPADRATPAEPSAPAAPLPPTVMVVDDSLTVRKFTGRLLEREGYTVLVARDGVEALEKLQDCVPDVMLVDIEMPRMDGFDLTRNVRADPRIAGVPIIIISSRIADKHQNHARELGVNDFLGKPYLEDELLAHIAGFVKPAAAA